MVEHKYVLKFNDRSVHDSVTYILVSEFNIAPSVLQAKIDDDGGVLILSLNANEATLKSAVERLKTIGISVRRLNNQISRDRKKCVDCTSCVSICPSGALYVNRETWEVKLAANKCIACGSCLTACPTHAVKLTVLT